MQLSKDTDTPQHPPSLPAWSSRPSCKTPRTACMTTPPAACGRPSSSPPDPCVRTAAPPSQEGCRSWGDMQEGCEGGCEAGLGREMDCE